MLVGVCMYTYILHGQAKAEYAPYYRHSLLYLACVDTEKDMSREERLGRAHDLGISAFLGDTIYNFGELVCFIFCLFYFMGIFLFISVIAYASYTGRVEWDAA